MTVTPVPLHMRALARANQVRLARAEAKRRVAAGELDVTIAMMLPEVQSARVYDVLTWQRGWGPHRTNRLLNRLAINPYRPVEQLTDRQYRLIQHHLPREGT